MQDNCQKSLIVKILAIIGSASPNSSNLKLVEFLKESNPDLDIEIINNLSNLPHFDTELTDKNTPKSIEEIRSKIENEKPVSIVTASASGEKGHEELKLILETLGANVDEKNSILIKGIKGRFDEKGNLNPDLQAEINQLMIGLKETIAKYLTH